MHQRRVLLVALFCVGMALTGSVVMAQQGSGKQVADEIIAIVRAQWAADLQKNTAESMKNIADDYTELNGDYSTRLEGKALLTRLAEASVKGSQSMVVAEMANPKVQVYGDVAVLSYNFVGLTQDKDGKTTPVRAKSTRVYAKQGGKWMLVHANFAPDPLHP